MSYSEIVNSARAYYNNVCAGKFTQIQLEEMLSSLGEIGAQILHQYLIIKNSAEESGKGGKMHLILFGPPNSGKGTQGARLIAKFGTTPVITGNMFRSFIKSEFVNGDPLFPFQTKFHKGSDMATGNLIDDTFTCEMVRAFISAQPKNSIFDFDGFPRTVPQAEFLDIIFPGGFKGAVIELVVPEEQLWVRAQERKREDSERNVFDTRLNEYMDMTRLVLPYFKGAKIPVIQIDGTGTPDEVFGRLEAQVHFMRQCFRCATRKSS